MKLTLLQHKNRPVHQLRPRGKSAVPYTYCGVDPCRKGIRVSGIHVSVGPVTCSDCLAQAKMEAVKRASP
jgi:hypothetical protein